DLSFLDFNDCNNCNSRAHIMAAAICKKFPNISVAKLWLFSDGKRVSQKDNYDEKTKYMLSFKNKCLDWGYHVAAIIIIEHPKGRDTVVIDPTTQPRPVSISQWALNLIPQKGKGFLIIKDKRYFTFPKDGDNNFEDLKSEWTDE